MKVSTKVKKEIYKQFGEIYTEAFSEKCEEFNDDGEAHISFWKRLKPNGDELVFEVWGIYDVESKEFSCLEDAETFLNEHGYVCHYKSYHNWEYINADIKSQKEKVNRKNALIIQKRKNLFGDFEKWVKENGEKVYLRFGKIPTSGKSYNFRDRFFEKGVSAYEAYKIGGNYILNPGGSFFTFISYIGAKQAYIVDGNELDTTGSDGEPLLSDARIVKKTNENHIWMMNEFLRYVMEGE